MDLQLDPLPVHLHHVRLEVQTDGVDVGVGKGTIREPQNHAASGEEDTGPRESRESDVTTDQ